MQILNWSFPTVLITIYILEIHTIVKQVISQNYNQYSTKKISFKYSNFAKCLGTFMVVSVLSAELLSRVVIYTKTWFSMVYPTPTPAAYAIGESVTVFEKQWELRTSWTHEQTMFIVLIGLHKLAKSTRINSLPYKTNGYWNVCL